MLEHAERHAVGSTAEELLAITDELLPGLDELLAITLLDNGIADELGEALLDGDCIDELMPVLLEAGGPEEGTIPTLLLGAADEDCGVEADEDGGVTALEEACSADEDEPEDVAGDELLPPSEDAVPPLLLPPSRGPCTQTSRAVSQCQPLLHFVSSLQIDGSS